LAANFLVFASLNLAGAVLVHATIDRAPPMAAGAASGHAALTILRMHLRNRALRAAFAIGFCILFAFIGTFTYVNFVLVRPPIGIGMMTLGFVYFVFLPSIFTTPVAGRFVGRFGLRSTLWAALAVAAVGLPLLVLPSLPSVVVGLMLVGVGTFFAQAVTTGFVGRSATSDRGAASGIYLACYFSGGLVGSALLGQVFDQLGWPACVCGIGASLVVAALLTRRITLPPN
jgi:predicted MFS family arabinose efflux permease